jgi:hypothetical protein
VWRRVRPAGHTRYECAAPKWTAGVDIALAPSSLLDDAALISRRKNGANRTGVNAMDSLVDALRLTSIGALIVATGWMATIRFPRLVARFVAIRNE